MQLGASRIRRNVFECINGRSCGERKRRSTIHNRESGGGWGWDGGARRGIPIVVPWKNHIADVQKSESAYPRVFRHRVSLLAQLQRIQGLTARAA